MSSQPVSANRETEHLVPHHALFFDNSLFHEVEYCYSLLA